MAEGQKGPNFEEIGKKLEEIPAHLEALESIIMSEYYSIVKQEKLYHKEHVFDDKLKNQLIDNIAKALKEQLLRIDPKYQGISDYVFEDSVMQVFFGVNKTDMQHMFKDVKRITKHEISNLVEEIGKGLGRRLQGKALEKITIDDLESGKQYLRGLNEQYKLGLKPEKIKKEEHLHQNLWIAHQELYNKKLREKYG